MSTQQHKILGWGVVDAHGVEIWDAEPVFLGDCVRIMNKAKLLFYPKKFLLYSCIAGDIRKKRKEYGRSGEKYRILDVGCGTGSAVIDMKKMFGKHVEVVGIEVVKMQVHVAKQKLERHGVWANIYWFDGTHMSFDDGYFDAVYSSDVLGHVEHVEPWLSEIHRILKPDGVLAMFVESQLGKHAYIRNYLMKRGLNTDPHKEFHISLFSKQQLKKMIEIAGFNIRVMYTTVWAKFLVHPDELYPAFQEYGGFFFLRHLNASMSWIKKKTHPYSTAMAELYSLLEMFAIGRWVESQGYVVLCRKK